MKINLFNLILCILISLPITSTWGEEAVRSQESQDPRQLMEKFRAIILPQLHLSGEIASTAIDKLNQLGFQCTLVGEQKDLIYPSKSWPSAVECTRLFSNEDRIFGWMWVYVHMGDWKGDGTPLAVRLEQLAESKVDAANASGGITYDDNRDVPSSKEAGRHLDQSLIIASPGQPMAEVVKYAMLHDISCRATVPTVDHRTALDCSMVKPSSQCRHALISIEVTDGTDPSKPLSLWSADRFVKGKQDSWICLNAINAPMH